MAKLILSMDGLVLKEIPLTKERTSIGRKPHNDIQIDNLAVSGEHAAIVTILNDSFLEDLGSTNGTVVNGNPIKKHFLQNNDLIELGKYKLKFIGDAAPVVGGDRADFEKTMVLRPKSATGGAQAAVAPRPAAVQQAGKSAAATGLAEKDAMKSVAATSPVPPGAMPLAMPAAAPATTANAPAAASFPAAASAPAPAPAPASSAAPRPRPSGQFLGAIQLLSGANAGRELELIKPLTTLGKPGVQVAVLTRRPQGYFITHVEGANRPIVNGQAIGAAPHSLKDHDVIELAGVKMEFFLKA
jgi:pSer/pThr/pTyr-binding forkhead associated (FHA) protein